MVGEALLLVYPGLANSLSDLIVSVYKHESNGPYVYLDPDNPPEPSEEDKRKEAQLLAEKG